MWIDGDYQIVFDRFGALEKMLVRWRFDKAYSAWATQGLGSAKDGPSIEELAPLTKTNMDSLAEYKFFIRALAGQQAIENGTPKNAKLEAASDKSLTLSFELPFLGAPRPDPDFTLKIGDPTNFVDLSLENATFSLQNAPRQCTVRRQNGRFIISDKNREPSVLLISCDRNDEPNEAVQIFASTMDVIGVDAVCSDPSLKVSPVLLRTAKEAATLNEGIVAFRSGRFTDAKAALSNAFRHRNFAAGYFLGQMYQLGQGVPADPYIAARCYEIAARAGYVLAQHNLAVLYDRGSGVERSYTKSLYWFERAVAGEDSFAKVSLGRRLLAGGDFPKDVSRAMRLLTQAAESGQADAAFLLGSVYLNGNGIDNLSEGLAWINAAAEDGVPEAFYALGKSYWTGHGTEKDAYRSFVNFTVASLLTEESALRSDAIKSAGLASRNFTNAERVRGEREAALKAQELKKDKR